jgi:hypothetical protein
MNLKHLLGRAGRTALGVAAVIVGGLAVGWAANLNLSTGAHFVPTGPALFQGSDLNLMVDAINVNTANIANGVSSGNNLIGTGVNKLSLLGAATLNEPQLTVGGASSDTNIGIAILGKGTGNACLGGTTCANGAVQAVTTASSVDFLRVTGAATANPGVVTALATGTDTNVALNVLTKGSGNVKLGIATAAACSGTTTATCQGQRFLVTITGLTTAASTISAAMTVTDANVLAAGNQVMCQVQGYGGTGVPEVVNVTPGTGTVAMQIQNVSTGAALNANVVVACVVFGA